MTYDLWPQAFWELCNKLKMAGGQGKLKGVLRFQDWRWMNRQKRLFEGSSIHGNTI